MIIFDAGIRRRVMLVFSFTTRDVGVAGTARPVQRDLAAHFKAPTYVCVKELNISEVIIIVSYSIMYLVFFFHVIILVTK